MSKLNIGMGISVGMGIGDHKFKNVIAGSLKNSGMSDLVIINIRW